MGLRARDEWDWDQMIKKPPRMQKDWSQEVCRHAGAGIPDTTILRRAPTEVWLLGGGGYPLHPALAAGPHLGGL